MGYKYVVDHTKVNFNYGNSGRKYIVIHYTGNNTDSAAGNANYFRNVNRDASAHLFVDENYIYEVVDLDNTAWSVGVNFGGNNLFGTCNNRNSISIEMCSTNGKIADATFKNTVEITKKLMKQYNIPAKNVVRHYDVCSKICPGWKGWIKTGKSPDSSLWDKFKKDISGTSNIYTLKTNAGKYTKNEADPMGKTSVAKGAIKAGTKVKVIKDDKYGWSKVKYGNKTAWIVNSHIGSSSLSKYPEETLKKGTRVMRLSDDKKEFLSDHKLDKSAHCKVLSEITSGKYKGWKYVKFTYNNKYYYVK